MWFEAKIHASHAYIFSSGQITIETKTEIEQGHHVTTDVYVSRVRFIDPRNYA
ncbi:unnamed protein product [Pararhodospirillum photometricum DSM 122]|uniref:Uncharacterized protein n=1 Tax=Pararhodospirillum photometricum DSM 122 TaxID=1150469 RepID=H6SNE2_PARPM|nr:unnamed protein product [Pararhodospirillum photometricum DSM 122]CCG09273.1 unnamed protein product [Pararhodospirillum photometricum DSM 122]